MSAMKPAVYSFQLQEYEVNLIREACELYKERFRGPWVQNERGWGYAPTKGSRRLDFIIKHLAREAERHGLKVPAIPWPQGYSR